MVHGFSRGRALSSTGPLTEIVQELGDVASELLDSQNRDDPDKTNGNERTMLQGECV